MFTHFNVLSQECQFISKLRLNFKYHIQFLQTIPEILALKKIGNYLVLVEKPIRGASMANMNSRNNQNKKIKLDISRRVDYKL